MSSGGGPPGPWAGYWRNDADVHHRKGGKVHNYYTNSHSSPSYMIRQCSCLMFKKKGGEKPNFINDETQRNAMQC